MLIDSQVINHPILKLFDWDGKGDLPVGTFERAEPIRDAVLSALEEIAPPSMSYVFTNVLYAESGDIALYERLKHVAGRRQSVFLPVLLTCERDVQLRRVAAAERVRRNKVSDPEALRREMETTRLYTPPDSTLLTLDTTELQPQQAAATIAETIRRLDTPKRNAS